MATHCYSGINLLHCGCQEGFWESGGALTVGKGDISGIFVSRIYDSGREGTQWNRIRLDAGPDAAVEVYVWLSDRREEYEEEFLQENPREWLRAHKGLMQYHSDYRNMLLYGHGCGRYARAAVEIQPGDGGDTVFRGYDLSFPKESFAEYLPEIYQNQLPLDRFLALQQYMYLQLEENVDNLAERLDYELCSRKQAVRLAGWMGWGELARHVEKDILRELLKTGVSLSEKKGTCEYYVKMTEILTGQKAVIVEEPEACRARVLVLGKPENGRERHLEWLKRNVPIGISIEFVILDKTDRLDGQYFLNYSSYVSEYESELSEEGCPMERMRLL